MSGRPRNPENKKLPRNLYVSSGYYRYRVGMTGEEIGLGRSRLSAIRFAVDANLHVGMRPTRPSEMPPSAAAQGLLSADQIGEAAKQYSDSTGIYFLLLEGRIVYVGQSGSCYRRVYEHGRCDSKRFDSYHIIPCPQELLNALERAYILKFAPPFNVNVPEFDTV